MILLFTVSAHTYKKANNFMQSIHFNGPSVGSFAPCLIRTVEFGCHALCKQLRFCTTAGSEHIVTLIYSYLLHVLLHS